MKKASHPCDDFVFRRSSLKMMGDSRERRGWKERQVGWSSMWGVCGASGGGWELNSRRCGGQHHVSVERKGERGGWLTSSGADLPLCIA